MLSPTLMLFLMQDPHMVWVALQDPCHHNWSPEQNRNQKCWGGEGKKQTRQAAQTTPDEGTEPELAPLCTQHKPRADHRTGFSRPCYKRC